MLTAKWLADVVVPTVNKSSGIPLWAWVIGAIGGAVATGLVTYLVARRTSSGRIDTSEAATLWTESQSMRKELRDEVVSVRAKCDVLQKKIEDLERENTALKIEAVQCRQQMDDALVKLDAMTKRYNALRRKKTTR